MNKGGKYVFGISEIKDDGTVRFPSEAVTEYGIASEGRVYLFTGSKSTGGFCVTRKGLLLPSKLGHILTETPCLLNYTSKPGEFVRYKGRAYCHIGISESGEIILDKATLDYLKLTAGMRLLSIRSSDIAFTMGAEGPLLKKAESFDGDIPVY